MIQQRNGAPFVMQNGKRQGFSLFVLPIPFFFFFFFFSAHALKIRDFRTDRDVFPGILSLKENAGKRISA